MKLRKVLVATGLTAVLLAGGAANCSEGETSGKPEAPGAKQPAKKKGNVDVLVHIQGTGKKVWILATGDGKTLDVQDSYRLPYVNEFFVSFGFKVEAKNGPEDRGSITCTVSINGAPYSHTAYGPSAMVVCGPYDLTRA